MIDIFTTEIRTHLAQTRPDTMQTRLLVSKKSRKMVKRGIILTGGYSDYYCKRPLYSTYFLFSFLPSFVDSVVFFTASTTGLQWSHRLLAGYLQCKVRQTGALHTAFVLHMERFRGYSYVWGLF